MHQTTYLSEKFKLFLVIFLPILIYQLANFSSSFIDTMMTGQFSTVHLAGVAIGTSLWNPFFTFLTGIVSALIPIIGQHLGSGNEKKIASDFWQFLYLSLYLAVFLFLLVFLGSPFILHHMPLDAEVAHIAKDFLFYMMFGIVPFLIFSVFRSFFDSLGLTKLSMYLMLLVVPFNAFFNYVLIYGKFGLPSMGGAGAGLGTALSYWMLLMIVFLVVLFHPKIQPYQLFRPRPFDKNSFLSALYLGLPIGGMIFVESGIFNVIGLYMSKFSSEIIASYQAAMNFVTLLYAFPLSISMAMAILISYEMGARRSRDVLSYTKLGRTVAILFSSITMLFLYFFRFRIAAWYGSEADFLRLTAIFLTYALCFQVADAFAAPIQGILRGYQDTNLPFWIGLLSYWGIPLPLGLLLENSFHLGPYSYWISLIVAIFTCGLFLRIRLRWMEKKHSSCKESSI